MTPFQYEAHLRVLAEVTNERLQQEKTWGQQDHDNFMWLTILGEEYGEACEAALELIQHKTKALSTAHLRAELLQVAAVAVAHIETIDRNKS